MKTTIKQFKFCILPVAKLIFFLAFIAYIPLPAGIGTGLNPSWQYAISRAAEDKLTFGQDIIFTYGPFGYLIHGSVLNSNFLSIFGFRLTVHIALYIVTLLKSLEIKTIFYKILLYFSIIVSYQIGPSTDYEIIFAFIMLLSLDMIRDSKWMRWWSLGLGAVAGFCLLTKFTVGICTVGSIVLVLSGNIYDSFKSKSNTFFYISCLFNAAIAFISVAFLLVDYNYSSNFKELLFCFAYASAFSLLTRLLLIRVKPLFVNENSKSKLLSRIYKNIFTSPHTSWLMFDLSFFIFLIIKITNASPALLNFIKGSLQISSGYSSAMSIVGSPWELGFAISQIFIISTILILLIKENPNKRGLFLSLGFILWLTFKHGFIRQDGHVFIFICATPLIIALCINYAKTTKRHKILLMVHSYAVLIFFLYSLFPHPFAQHTNISAFQALYPQNFLLKISTLLDINQFQKNIKASTLDNLDKVKLPEGIKNKVAGKVIDVFPWELSLVEANNLNWKPRPVIQSYSAYTKYLDSKNFKSITKYPRDYLFYNFYSIDFRHPFFDEPETFFNIFCNYQFSENVDELSTSDSLNYMILLEPRSSNICSNLNIPSKKSIRWNQEELLKLNNADLMRAKVKIKYSLLGKIYKTIFRAPPVYLQVNYSSGNISEYRIIPENSENGIIISHLPAHTSEALSLFKGQLPIPVQSFSLINKNSLLYLPNIELSYIPIKFINSSIQKTEWIDTSKLKNIIFKNDNENRYLTSFDSNNENTFDQDNQRQIINIGDAIHISGWAVDRENLQTPLWILITDGENKKITVINKTGSPKPNLAKHFQNEKYSTSGWFIQLASKKLGKGSHDLKAWTYDPNNNSATPMNGTFHIEIKQ